MKVMWKIALVVVLFVLMLMVSLSVGEVEELLTKLFGIGGATFTETDVLILREIRLPRVLMAIGVGAMLSMSGMVMQSMFCNPLVEPYTMGLSGGAVLGVAVAYTLGITNIGSAGVTIMAMLGAMFTMALVLLLRRVMQFDINKMLLSGVMISFATSSVTLLLMSLTTRENMSQIIMWNMGSLDVSSKQIAYFVVVVAIVMAAVLPFMGEVMNVMSVSENLARHVGIRVQYVVPLFFVVATLMAAVSVSFVGVIAFVGMIVPHIVRLLFGYDHRLTLVMSALCGGLFMMMCDVVSRLIIYPQEIPTGVMCGIIGGAMFIYLTAKRR